MKKALVKKAPTKSKKRRPMGAIETHRVRASSTSKTKPANWRALLHRAHCVDHAALYGL
jgi:hypothetical protein